jgi:hypothetical protein
MVYNFLYYTLAVVLFFAGMAFERMVTRADFHRVKRRQDPQADKDLARELEILEDQLFDFEKDKTVKK